MLSQLIEMMGLGCLLCMAVFHIIVYFDIKRNYSLYFGLLCLAIFFRTALISDGSQFLYVLMPSLPNWLGYKISYVAIYSIPALFTLFIYDIFRIKHYLRYLAFFKYSSLALIVAVIVSPYTFYRGILLPVFDIILLSAFVLVFTILYWASKRKKIGANAILAGITICFLFALFEIIRKTGPYLQDFDGFNLISAGIIGYLFFQSVAISTIFAKSFTANQQVTKELEEKVAARTEELSKSNLVKDRFIQVVSHDLRGPLGNLKATVDLLQTGSLKPGETQELFGRINKRVDQSLGMLDDMLEWSKVSVSKESEDREVINMNELIEKTISLSDENAFNKDILVRFVSKEQLSIDSDHNAVHVVLRNLMSNAIKFTPRNGNITVILDKAEGQVRVKVIDSGIGIPDEMKETLFDMERKNSRSGTEQEQSSGVGLALCRDLMNKINGRITVDDNPSGNGTVFTCWFGKNVVA
jgi:signal transduction histidine kinase